MASGEKKYLASTVNKFYKRTLFRHYYIKIWIYFQSCDLKETAKCYKTFIHKYSHFYTPYLFTVIRDFQDYWIKYNTVFRSYMVLNILVNYPEILVASFTGLHRVFLICNRCYLYYYFSNTHYLFDQCITK